MEQIDFPEIPSAGDLEVRWIHGSESAKHNTDPDIQVHRYDEHTYVLRQNKSINYEAPFMFLMFGNARALLLDTGATASPAYFPLRRTVDEIVARWLADHPREGYGLLVAHTHGHGDHIAGDGQFRDRPDTVIVDPAPERVREFFGLGDDLDVPGTVDLGGRVLDVLASPGHHRSAVTFYDRPTGLLLTGDTVYPGRLYVADWPAFEQTIDRLVKFAEARPVTHVLGCHIEMTNAPGEDYPIRTTYQPDEPPLQMTVEHLRQIRDAVAEIGGRPGVHVYPEFIVYN
ncbi:MBL fold metallo-hydrolase [Microbispora sp. GKU 823]|uniref:MBL fold metallo-hydrolase n=1 Tax=Microbispora sp. GKU 823 TaxID=1652100 RepID=UPI0009A2EEE2|nr:MBL fold metallo-hydrolase [Microbispora sp. GKU 823]OPG04066.1 MBL fold metallo-hydrolase [Microbispora sp. GKU 823]